MNDADSLFLISCFSSKTRPLFQYCKLQRCYGNAKLTQRMPKINNDIENTDLVLTESIRYDPQTDMITCPGCGRLSPPDRSTCIYCGRELPVTEASRNVAPKHLRRPEGWENGFNVVFVSVAEDIGKVNPEILADALSLDVKTVTKILDLGGPLPVFRAASETDAMRLSTYLRSNGLACAIVADKTLSVDAPPRRIRRVDFLGEAIKLTLFNTGNVVEASRENVGLFVTGAIIETKTETAEKRKRGKSEVLDQAEVSSDETVIDIYLRDETTGYRIIAGGFDFSGLGAKKTLLAVNNMKALTEELFKFAPDAKQVDYLERAAVLDQVWEPDERTTVDGVQRIGFGKTAVKRTGRASNLRQFTKFSRMHRHLL